MSAYQTLDRNSNIKKIIKRWNERRAHVDGSWDWTGSQFIQSHVFIHVLGKGVSQGVRGREKGERRNSIESMEINLAKDRRNEINFGYQKVGNLKRIEFDWNANAAEFNLERRRFPQPNEPRPEVIEEK